MWSQQAWGCSLAQFALRKSSSGGQIPRTEILGFRISH